MDRCFQGDCPLTKRHHRQQIIRGHTQVPNVVLLDRRLSPDARWIYVMLKVHDRPRKGECWPGQERLAELAGWETRKGLPDRWRVQRALDELEDACLITRRRGGARRSNTYYLNPVPDELPAIELSPVRTDRGKTRRKPASERCASDAHRLEASFQSNTALVLRNGAQQENGLQDELSRQYQPVSCARRSTSSVRGEGSSSSLTVDVVDGDGDSGECVPNATANDYEVPQELIEAGIAWAQEPFVDRLLIELYKLGCVRITRCGTVLQRARVSDQ